MNYKPLKPDETLEVCINVGVAKANNTIKRLFLLGILAGAFIAFAAQASSMASFNLISSADTFGVGKALQGIVFAPGLVMVILAGGELFTGNVLMITSLLEKKITSSQLLKNWAIVYIGNLCGAILIAFLIYRTGQWANGYNLLGATTIKIAAGKTSLTLEKAFILGILCNWLVCIAVWMSFATESFSGKILGIILPIWLFVTSGFEHSIANMYYIPAGLFAKQTKDFLLSTNIPTETLQSLTWTNFFIKNLIPVTLGNIVGGGLFVATIYWLCYHKKEMPKHMRKG